MIRVVTVMEVSSVSQGWENRLRQMGAVSSPRSIRISFMALIDGSETASISSEARRKRPVELGKSLRS